MNMTEVLKASARRPIGRRSRYRSGKRKEVLALSLTPECIAQINEMTARHAVGSRSEFMEALVWWAARRKRLLQ